MMLFGGRLCGAAGVGAVTGLGRYLPLDSDYAFIALFMIMVAIPAFVYSWKEVLATRKLTAPKS